MKFDSDIKGLVRGVSAGCGILCAIEVVIGIVLYAAGLFHAENRLLAILGVLLGSVGGTAVAILVFVWMAASLQRSLDAAQMGGAAVKKGVQAGYGKRLLAQGIWVVIAIFVPFLNTICGLIPLLFPKLAIYALQITGRLNLTQPSSGGKGGEN